MARIESRIYGWLTFFWIRPMDWFCELRGVVPGPSSCSVSHYFLRVVIDWSVALSSVSHTLVITRQLIGYGMRKCLSHSAWLWACRSKPSRFKIVKQVSSQGLGIRRWVSELTGGGGASKPLSDMGMQTTLKHAYACGQKVLFFYFLTSQSATCEFNEWENARRR